MKAFGFFSFFIHLFFCSFSFAQDFDLDLAELSRGSGGGETITFRCPSWDPAEIPETVLFIPPSEFIGPQLLSDEIGTFDVDQFVEPESRVGAGLGDLLAGTTQALGELQFGWRDLYLLCRLVRGRL